MRGTTTIHNVVAISIHLPLNVRPDDSPDRFQVQSVMVHTDDGSYFDLCLMSPTGKNLPAIEVQEVEHIEAAPPPIDLAAEVERQLTQYQGLRHFGDMAGM